MLLEQLPRSGPLPNAAGWGASRAAGALLGTAPIAYVQRMKGPVSIAGVASASESRWVAVSMFLPGSGLSRNSIVSVPHDACLNARCLISSVLQVDGPKNSPPEGKSA